MKTRLSFLSSPIVLISLWLMVASLIYNPSWPQTVLTLTKSRFILNTDLVITVLLIFLAGLSLILAIRQQGFANEMEIHQKNYKQTLKQLKKQHQQETHQIQTLMGNEQFAYWEWHIKSNSAQFSAQWKKMVGLPNHAEIGNLHDLQNRIHPKDKAAVQQTFFKILGGDQPFFECTHRVQHEDGHYLWVHDKGQVFYTDSGEVDKLCAIRLDVSAQKWIEAELEVDATIIEHAVEGIAIFDATMAITRCNSALRETFKKLGHANPANKLETLLANLQSTADDRILSTLQETGSWRGEVSLHDSDGTLVQASRISLQKIFHETTQSLHYSFIHSDITDLKQTQAALNDLANRDNVTGLANRNRLYHQLENNLEQNQPITLMFMDLDNFKPVNDRLGHDIGDQLLKAVGERIAPLLPENALLARVGGDEFVLFYPQVPDKTQPGELAQQISQQLTEPFELEEHRIQISSSIGIAHYPQQATDRGTLLKAADTAMYQAKRAGKGQYCEPSPHVDNTKAKTVAA